MTLMLGPRGRKTLISREDMVFITEITAGPKSLKELCVCVVRQSGIRCRHKTFIYPDVSFKDRSGLLVVRGGRHLQLQLLPMGGTTQYRSVSDTIHGHNALHMCVCVYIYV